MLSVGWRGRRLDPTRAYLTFGRGRIGIGETALEGATESGHVYDYESTHNGLGWGDVMGELMLCSERACVSKG